MLRARHTWQDPQVLAGCSEGMVTTVPREGKKGREGKLQHMRKMLLRPGVPVEAAGLASWKLACVQPMLITPGASPPAYSIAISVTLTNCSTFGRMASARSLPAASKLASRAISKSSSTKTEKA